MEPNIKQAIEHSPVRQMEDMTKRLDFIMDLQREQNRMTIKPTYIPFGMKLIETPNMVRYDGTA